MLSHLCLSKASLLWHAIFASFKRLFLAGWTPKCGGIGHQLLYACSVALYCIWISIASTGVTDRIERAFSCTYVSYISVHRLTAAHIHFRTGVQVPRVELLEAGPFFSFQIRRTQEAATDLMREALHRPSSDKKKQKNVGFDEVDGKIGRIYMPKQDLTGLNLVKAKGLKRQRREAAQERQAKKRVSKEDAAAA